MTCWRYYAWYNHDDGLKLMEEVYASFGRVPRPGTKGLKIRIPGIGQGVLERGQRGGAAAPW